MSQDYKNDAAEYDMSTGAGAPGTGNVDKVTLGVHYDAAAHSYTITYPRSDWFSTNLAYVFTPADIQASTNPNITIYKVYYPAYNGNYETDVLILSKNNASTTTYVGAGFSIRSFNGSLGNTHNAYTVFSYGLETPDGAVPRSGSAHYDVTLLGGYVHPTFQCTASCSPESNYVNALTGTGGIDVNFASGSLALSGQAQETDPATNAPGANMPFSGTASLAALTNNFNGSFSLGTGGTFSGNWLGRFYGPAAEEVGATFYAIRTVTTAFGTTGNESVLGAIIGKRGPISASTGFDSFSGWNAGSVPGAALFAPELATGANRPTAESVRSSLLRDVVPDLHALHGDRTATASER